MKKLLACLVLLNLSVVTSGLGMKMPEPDFIFFDNGPGLCDEWGKLVKEAFDARQKLCDESSRSKYAKKLIREIVLNVTCRDLIVASFTEINGLLSMPYFKSEMKSLQTSFFEPMFKKILPILRQTFKISDQVLREKFKSFIKEYWIINEIKLHAVFSNQVLFLVPDFFTEYVYLVYKSLPGMKKIEEIEKAGFKKKHAMPVMLEELILGTYQGKLLDAKNQRAVETNLMIFREKGIEISSDLYKQIRSYFDPLVD
ncbi:MAG: hypothetical protein ABH827_05690 [bacterium]